LTGQTIAHYRIEQEIGAGGMGRVYRARDLRLQRDVALKVLPAGTLADETARSRFRREALTLSQLNHPNIAVIHDFDSEQGVDFLIMEYVEGETLAAKVSAGPLPEKEIIALATQIAQALEDAHERGVIHRDLTPRNVMVTPKGRVKVLDFGLAKLVKPKETNEATVSLTESQPGAVAGTVPYMAPEQLRGKPVDARTDVYALGAVLYEMATGGRPFPERDTSHLIAAILTRAPSPPRELNRQVSAGLEAIILKALEKNPDRRYQSAKEALHDLGRLSVPGARVGTQKRVARRWMIAAASAVVVLLAVLVGLNVGGVRDRLLRTNRPSIQSLAVLPLENVSGDPHQDYFADGMTDQLITDLAKIRALKVISRTSMMKYKETKKSLPQIAQELNVDAVVEGSVLREGNRVRITAQLVNARTDQNLWADSYERDLRSVLTLQGEIARAVAGKIRAALTPAERSQLAAARPVNPEAYEAYLKGMQYWYKATPQDWDTALQYFQLALKEDPNSARAYAGICLVWAGRAQFGVASPSEAAPREKAAALKAIELDSTLPEAHFALASVKAWSDWDWAAAEPEFQKAIELDPNYADARAYYSHLLMILGRPEEGVRQMERALELDPLNGLYRALYAGVLMWNRRYDDAIEQARLALRTTPANPVPYCVLWRAYSFKAMHKEALSAAEGCNRSYANPEINRALDQGFAEGGYTLAMRRAAEVLVAAARKSFVSPVDIAGFYCEAGEKAKAIDWLEKGYEVRDPNMPYLGVPALDSLRSDPRFQDLMGRMNLPK
jgi:serine/threonine protein kinase